MSAAPAQLCLGACISALAGIEPSGPSSASAQVGKFEVTVTIVPVENARHPGRDYTRCERDVLVVLADAHAPLPAPRVVAELERRQLLHGESTVIHALSRLAGDGVIVSSRRHPRGYTLPHPDQSPFKQVS